MQTIENSAPPPPPPTSGQAPPHSEERFHLLSDVLPVGAFYSDGFGHCLYVNRRWQEITGLTLEQSLGDGWQNVIDPKDREGVPAEWSARRAGPFMREFVIVTPVKERRWVRFRAEPMRDKRGTLIGRAGVLATITGVRNMEAEPAGASDEALQAGGLKTASLANMSHEIRTPMNGIIGMSHLLLNTPLSSEQRGYAKTIHHSSEALLRILNDILDISKIEAGKLTFEVIDFNLRELLESTLELLAARAQTNGLELGCLLPPKVPILLRGDPCRLRQVIVNLVANAIKFTEQGEVLVTVEALDETVADVTLRLAVRDTGIGISPEARRRLFQPFTQAN